MELGDDTLDGLEGEQLQFALFSMERAEAAADIYRLNIEGALAAGMAVFQPPPRLKVSEWADQYRQLPPEDSAEPGKWQTSRAEYQRGIMDAFNDPTADTVVVKASAQVGKTAILLNVCGFVMHQDPGPIMVLQPTKDMAEVFSKDRLDPMVRDTPALFEIMGEGKAREKKNTIWRKQFPGGQISMVGTNSPSSLASRPIRIVLADEVDRYPVSAGDEGDPLLLAFKRTTTFWNKKKFVVSTPTIKNHSRIDNLYGQSDQRQWHVGCPDCGHRQVMQWGGVRWQDNDPATAEYACEGCGVLWDESKRIKALAAGEWIATAEFRGTIGFHLNQLISPFVTLADCVREFLEAKRAGKEALKVWTNTVLGEVWDDDGEGIEDSELMARRVDYGDVSPAPVQVVTVGVDVQADRLELERVGWAADDVTYGLGKFVLWGDTTQPEVWEMLDELLLQPIPHATRAPLKVMAAAVDSQYNTQAVASWCRDRWGRRVWAIRGVAGEGKPIWPTKPGKRNKTRLPFFNVGVDTAKEVVYARLRVQDPSAAGYCWFNKSYDEAHFDQLTAEVVKITYKKGMPVRSWHLKAGKKRNEALDCRAYALAAYEGLRMMGLRLKPVPDKPVEKEKPVEVAQDASQVEAPATPPPPQVVRKAKRRRSSTGPRLR